MPKRPPTVSAGSGGGDAVPTDGDPTHAKKTCTRYFTEPIPTRHRLICDLLTVNIRPEGIRALVVLYLPIEDVDFDVSTDVVTQNTPPKVAEVSVCVDLHSPAPLTVDDDLKKGLHVSGLVVSQVGRLAVVSASEQFAPISGETNAMHLKRLADHGIAPEVTVWHRYTPGNFDLHRHCYRLGPHTFEFQPGTHNSWKLAYASPSGRLMFASVPTTSRFNMRIEYWNDWLLYCDDSGLLVVTRIGGHGSNDEDSITTSIDVSEGFRLIGNRLFSMAHRKTDPPPVVVNCLDLSADGFVLLTQQQTVDVATHPIAGYKEYARYIDDDRASTQHLTVVVRYIPEGDTTGKQYLRHQDTPLPPRCVVRRHLLRLT